MGGSFCGQTLPYTVSLAFGSASEADCSPLARFTGALADGVQFAASTSGCVCAAGAVYSNLARDSGGIQNRLGSLAFMVLYLGVMGLSSLPIWRAERLLFIR